MSPMNWLKRWLHRDAEAPDVPGGVMPPSRLPDTGDPMTISSVFRGVQILQTAVSGLPIVESADGVDLPQASEIVTRPDVRRSRRDFVADVVASLCLDGNAFVELVRFGGRLVTCRVLPPSMVTVADRGTDPANPKLVYTYAGREIKPDNIVHMKFVNLPGRLRGLGPISAAREEIESARMARDYKAKFYTDSSNVKGYLKSDQRITPESAAQAKADWTAKGSANDIKVVGSNLTYVPLELKPADLQFLETQKFDTTQIARLLGIPAGIMIAVVEGSSLTYSNIEQTWIQFADYTLAAYAGELEEFFSAIAPPGHRVRFDWDSSHKSDTSTRYAAYKIALESGWMTVNEVRAREGLPAIREESNR